VRRRLPTARRRSSSLPLIASTPRATRILSAFETPYSALDINWGTRTSSTTISSRPPRRAQAAEETDLVVDDRANVDPSEHAHLSRLELASTLNGRDLFWSFAVPAGRDCARRAHPRAVLGCDLGVRPDPRPRSSPGLRGTSARTTGAAAVRPVRSTRQQASYDDVLPSLVKEGRHRRRDVLLRLGPWDGVRRLQ